MKSWSICSISGDRLSCTQHVIQPETGWNRAAIVLGIAHLWPRISRQRDARVIVDWLPADLKQRQRLGLSAVVTTHHHANSARMRPRPVWIGALQTPQPDQQQWRERRTGITATKLKIYPTQLSLVTTIRLEMTSALLPTGPRASRRWSVR
jgi:hypothetical protein